MATELERARLRADIDADAVTLPDPEADEIYDEAGERYTDTDAINAYARVIAIRRIMASAAKRASYTQNNSSEDLSDVFKHLKDLLQLWQGEVGGVVRPVSGVSFGIVSGRRGR